MRRGTDPQAIFVVRTACQARYTAVDAVRPTDPDHGGIAIIFVDVEDTCVSRLYARMPGSASICGKLIISCLVMLAIYRPGSTRPTTASIEDLVSLLESVCNLRWSLIVCEDLSVYVEEPIDCGAIRLAGLSTPSACTRNSSIMHRAHQLSGTFELCAVPQDIDDVPVAIYTPGVISYHSLMSLTFARFTLLLRHPVACTAGDRSTMLRSSMPPRLVRGPSTAYRCYYPMNSSGKTTKYSSRTSSLRVVPSERVAAH